MWITTLRLAERWHVLPSEVERMPGGLKWANRQGALDEVDARIAKIERKS